MTACYTTDQVAETMHLSRQAINNNIRRGNLKAEKRNHEGVYRYMVTASELRRFTAWWAEKRPDGKRDRWYKPLPESDEVTKYGATIFWTLVRTEPDPTNAAHTVRYVPVLCRCGLKRDLLTYAISRAKFRGLCMPCSSEHYAMRGANHYDWQGGVWINEDGYRFLHIDSLSDTDKRLAQAMVSKSRPYVAEHRLVVARRLGRPLQRHEHVHHRDQDKQNNDDGNLELVTPSHHAVVELVMARAEVRRLRELTTVLLAVILQRGE